MEITPWTIYLIEVVGAVGELAKIIAVVLMIYSAFLIFATVIATDGYMPKIREVAQGTKKLLIVSAICAFVSILAPSRTTLAAMYVIPMIANSEVVQQLPKELVALAKVYLQKLEMEGEK